MKKAGKAAWKVVKFPFKVLGAIVETIFEGLGG